MNLFKKEGKLYHRAIEEMTRNYFEARLHFILIGISKIFIYQNRQISN